MVSLSQIDILSPVLGERFFARHVVIREAMSRPFEIDLTMESDATDVDLGAAVGKPILLAIELAEGSKRYWHGIVDEFAQGEDQPRASRYEAKIVSWFGLLRKTSNCRIFQNQNVLDIIKKIFQRQGFTEYTIKAQASYEPREYCVQYRESDFDFASRLMEEEGIFYYFEHTEKGHRMILCDDLSHYDPVVGSTSLVYQKRSPDEDEPDSVLEWNARHIWRTAKISKKDYDYMLPTLNLMSKADAKDANKPQPLFENYDFPGKFDTIPAGKNVTKLSAGVEDANTIQIKSRSTAPALSPGYKFSLSGHFRDDQNDQYVVTSCEHVVAARADQEVSRTAECYENSFVCIPATHLYRPAISTRKPIVAGSQSAVVVGASGEEIDVDAEGRIVVQFHWDLEGKHDEHSTCRIRVAQPWAGSSFGFVFLPRIGTEVIVSFMEGDPDRPLVVGGVYNGVIRPAYKLPVHDTRSVIRTQTFKNPSGYNEISFEDKQGKEQIFIHGQKDLDLKIVETSRTTIGKNRHEHILGFEKTLVDGDSHETVKGNILRKIVKSSYLTIEGGSSQKIKKDLELNIEGISTTKVGGDLNQTVNGQLQEKVKQSVLMDIGQDLSIAAGAKIKQKAGMEVHIKAGTKIVIEAGMELLLKGPGGFIKIDPSGVSVEGMVVKINCGGAAGSAEAAATAQPNEPVDPKIPEAPIDAIVPPRT